MSRIDDERLGLGWEVWFLLALLAGGGLVAIQIVGLIGAGFDAAEQTARHRNDVGIDVRRLLVGGSVAVALAGAAVRLVVATDWRLDAADPGAGDRWL